jgi:hypothetical protein
MPPSPTQPLTPYVPLARTAAARHDLNLKPFDVAAAGDPAAQHDPPANSSTDSTMALTDVVAFAPGAIVVATGATGGSIAPDVLAPPPALDWDDCDAPFDMGIQLDFLAHTRPLCPLESDNDDASSSSEDNSIFINLSRD